MINLFIISDKTLAETNQAQAAINHSFNYCTKWDILSDTPIPLREGWGWWVGNISDSTGMPVIDVTFRTQTYLNITWAAQQPSSLEGSTYVWQYGVDVPENYLYWAGGDVDPLLTKAPGCVVKRQTSPPLLNTSEVLQTVKVDVVFTAKPLQNITVFVGELKNILYEGLVITAPVSQNDLPGWTKWTDYGARAAWSTTADNIEVGVSYHFETVIKSTKSPLITGNPVWKPAVNVATGIGFASPPPTTGNSCSLSHPEGVSVTFEAANIVEWMPGMGKGMEVCLESIVSPIIPCGNGQYCVTEDRDGDGIPDGEDNCPFTPNPGQEDSNRDGIGDACDVGEPTSNQYTLIVSKSGDGTGTVTSSPAGINCGDDCSEVYTQGTKVTLTAKADVNFTFSGWSGGGCTGTKTCTVKVGSEITVTASFALKTPDMSVSPGSLDFGSVKSGKKTTKTLKITNNGSGNLVITLLGLEGTDFSIQGSGTVTIKAKKSYSLKVLCTPTSGGLKTATLKIDSNDPDTPTLEVSLTATLPATTPDISVAQTSIEFGGIKIGKKATKTLKITNNGTGDLMITLSGLEETDFSIQGSSSVTIKTKKSYSLKVVFTPTSAGSKTATLKVESNDPDTKKIDISLSGTGQ